ncbi:O-antigen ligase family protein [Herbaspirillum seropedicae]|uniref:O-antigen ligase family protein n=1 Tax=Herbaspirillum seropedicae TaxID=964 RepID=UPI003D99B975
MHYNAHFAAQAGHAPLPSMPFYSSLAVFLLVALSLVVPSGFSLGSLMLVLGAAVLLRKGKPRAILYREDWLIMLALLSYFFVNAGLNLVHQAPGREYDAPLRFLLAIPALLLLRAYPPRPGALWTGAAIGAVGAGLLSLWQWLADGAARPGGSTNPIQYGNIAALLAILATCGLARAIRLQQPLRWKLMHAAGLILGLTASILSGSRGSWLALPVCATLAAWLLLRAGYARLVLQLGAGSLAMLVCLALLPQSPLSARLRLALAETNDYVQRADADSSVGTRLEMWRIGMQLAPQHLLVGWGKQGMIDAKHEMVSQGQASPSVDEHTHLHNEYLDALVKRGIPGLAALLVLYLLPLWLFHRQRRLAAGYEARLAASAGVMMVLSYLAFGLTQAFLTHNNGVMLYAFLCSILWALCQEQAVHPANTA